MKWLAEKGLNVVGCDIAGKAAELFFNENQIPFRECKKITVGYTCLCYETAGIMSSRCMTVTGISNHQYYNYNSALTATKWD